MYTNFSTVALKIILIGIRVITGSAHTLYKGPLVASIIVIPYEVSKPQTNYFYFFYKTSYSFLKLRLDLSNLNFL